MSLVVALVALFVALGGGAYAATTTRMGHNQLAPNSVWHNNIGKGSVHMDNLTSSLKAALDKTGKTGATGATGPRGATAPQGPAGTNGGAGAAGTGNPTGPQGPPGPSGVNDPFVYTFTGATGPDSGTCGNNWATDTYDATYTVTPLADGSINVVKFIQGSFVTVAGDSPASCGAHNTDQVSGGRTGTFYGTQSYSIPAPTSGSSADFNPTASCGVACSPDTAGTINSSNDAQNTAFDNAFFNGVAGTGGSFDFVYHAGSQTWVDSNTPSNNQGDISG